MLRITLLPGAAVAASSQHCPAAAGRSVASQLHPAARSVTSKFRPGPLLLLWAKRRISGLTRCETWWCRIRAFPCCPCWRRIAALLYCRWRLAKCRITAPLPPRLPKCRIAALPRCRRAKRHVSVPPRCRRELRLPAGGSSLAKVAQSDSVLNTLPRISRPAAAGSCSRTPHHNSGC